ncbi:hypothetical protein D7X98_04465 [bacterium 1XD8-76]|nr:hypothetical protein D7X98_04465 [bacterium 1XD8-76]
MKLKKSAACIFCAACLLAGCGSEGELLSELRAEKAKEPESAPSLDAEAPAEEPVETSAAQEEEKEAGGGSEKVEEPASIYVHVCGAVERPGVYEMPLGSRFYEAVETAGGFAEDACRDYLNMAEPLADGSRLEIPTAESIRAGEEKTEKEYSYYTVPETPAAQSESAGGSDAGLVNINTADIAGLCALPGVGEGRAKAIIEYREKQGGFQKKEDIMQVSGIGEKMYARMEEYLRVE